MKKIIKNLLLGFSIVVFSSSCSSSDDSSTDSTSQTGDYSNYDFYISEGSRGSGNGGISKNFIPLSGYERTITFYEDDPLKFKIYGSNIYTYSSKKYRTLDQNAPNYFSGTNFSGFVNKNNTTLYSNLGDGSSSVTDLQEAGSDVYVCTGYKFFEGGLGIDTAAKIGPKSKVYKNGSFVGNLIIPFNNWYYNSQGQVVNNYNSLTFINNMIVKGTTIYVAGFCYNIHNGNSMHYGFWVNGIFNEVYNGVYTTGFLPKLIIAENGDTYLGFSHGGKKRIFKGNTNIVTLDNVFFKDFGILGNDIISLGTFYDNLTNNYKLGVYKNGVMLANTGLYSSSNNTGDHKIKIIDNKIFICGSGINNEEKVAVYEFKLDSNLFVKVGTSGYGYAYNYVMIPDFEVIKK
jgi:hypothetical protein